MQFSTDRLDDPAKVVIEAVGEIIPGDFDRLVSYLRSLPPDVQVVGYTFDSPGGNLIEAKKIAGGLRRVQATVGVFGQSRCVSACFLLFAAGTKRLAEATALIGVHSASEAGVESTETLALTTAMARDVAEFGVPPGIIGKMVTASPGQVQWLTQHDLVSMGVDIIQPSRPQDQRPSGTSPPVASLPINPPSAAPPSTAGQEPPSFRQGLADRQNWEQWFESLSGPYLDGATFWAGHRSDHKAPSCYGNGGAVVEAPFSSGCLAAQQRLSAVDVRRKGDPDYRRGWNSF
jgi:hypothetical protein